MPDLSAGRTSWATGRGTSVVSFAQSASGPVTRAEVVARLRQLQQAGCKPLKCQYPDDIRAAEARVVQSSGTGADAAGSTGSVARRRPHR
ncbi:DUF4148 domain-containing protein [Burkholderia sp. Bp9140]|nr:DUF4148 domain-containing protein [Burkholderia sp. Bp9140]